MPKNYLALARVSSEEQEREGFSLDIQVDALNEWAIKNNANIIKMYRVAETGHKSEKRKTFHEMIDFAKKHRARVNGLLFYKMDRAARNMKDWIGLVELRNKYGFEIICITEQFDETPVGKFCATLTAATSELYSDQLSVRTKAGVDRRVECGLFPGHAPYGYENYRENGRGLIRVHAEHADNVRRAFELYAFHNHTLESLSKALKGEGRIYRKYRPVFDLSKLHWILTDRSYLGEISHNKQWYPGKHEALIDRTTFDRVAVLLGNRTYSSHESVYGSALVKCGYCGRPLVCEIKTKKTRNGEHEYRYYRCSRYTKGDHPRHRANEKDFDKAVLAAFDRLYVEEPKVKRWIEAVIRAKASESMKQSGEELRGIQAQIAKVEKDQNRLLNLRLNDEIDADTFKAKDAEFREQRNLLNIRLEGQGRQRSEMGELAVRAFELSQTLKNKWVTADIAEKRMILELVCLNLTLKELTLEISMRKPFDQLAKGLSFEYGSGGRI